MTVPFIGGFELLRAWDEDHVKARNLIEVYGASGARVCSSLAEVSEGVDLVFIAECNGGGEDHLKFAAPSLKKGIPTYVDKPIAYTLKDAQTIINLAKKHRTCMTSLSMLRELPDVARFRQRFAELEYPDFICVKGGGTAMAGHIHAISIAQHLCGAGVESVECMGKNELGFVHLNYAPAPDKPRNGVLLACDSGRTWHCSFYIMASSHKGCILSPAIGDFEYPCGAGIIARKIQKMVRTGKPPVPYEEILENIAVAEAARLAQKRGVAVKLTEVWKS
jgi:predicted dehydrogenase